MDKVCTRCFSDPDIKEWIREYGGQRGCNFCNSHSSATAALDDLCAWLEQSLSAHYAKAADKLPWNSREGGYQWRNWSSYELLFEQIGLDLPLDYGGELQRAIGYELSDDVWCDIDWMTLDEDEEMRFAWARFCNVIKHERRFFFQDRGSDEGASAYSAVWILTAIADLSDRLELVQTQAPGLRLYRARPDFEKRSPSARDFAPTTSNRVSEQPDESRRSAHVLWRAKSPNRSLRSKAASL